MHSKLPIGIVVIIFILGLVVISLRGESLLVTPSEQQALVANLAAQENQSSMVRLFQVTNATADYETGGPYTIFAPTDEAFAELPEQIRADLENLNNAEQLVAIENNHVVLGSYPSSVYYDGMKLTTTNAEVLTITEKDGEWYINDVAKVVGPTIKSNNGVIIPIDTVLLPQNY